MKPADFISKSENWAQLAFKENKALIIGNIRLTIRYQWNGNQMVKEQSNYRKRAKIKSSKTQMQIQTFIWNYNHNNIIYSMITEI